MRILIVRHGDPNYELDTLTETGWKEAELVAEKLSGFDIKAFYVSPLGRAQDTASCTLKKMHRTAETCEWMREFQGSINRPDVTDHKSICWDWLPQGAAGPLRTRPTAGKCWATRCWPSCWAVQPWRWPGWAWWQSSGRSRRKSTRCRRTR